MTRRVSSGPLRLALLYAVATLPMFALWEVAHAPLYALWVERGAAAGVRAALHCTTGDVVIALACALAGMLFATWMPGWRTRLRVGGLITVFGLLTTIVIELVSTQWLGRWAYRDAMPVDPVFGIGLSPLAQWLVVPAFALYLLRHRLQRALSALATADDASTWELQMKPASPWMTGGSGSGTWISTVGDVPLVERFVMVISKISKTSPRA